MKNIEIITAQNVVLQYELAGLRERVLAFLIDLACLVISLSILSGILMGIFSQSETAQQVVLVFISCIFIFYSLGFELWNNGQSIGKKTLNIQVIKMAGGKATFSDYAARWVFRLIDIYCSFGAIASLLVMSSTKAQRIGDVVANTAVVKIVPKLDLSLHDLLTIHKQDNYVPQYIQARKLREDDALLIKQAIDRYRKFKNTAHRESLELLAQRIQQMLEIEDIRGDQLQFLKAVLQDYVILTR